MNGNTDALFICEYVVDREKYLSWGKENNNHSVRRGFTVFWCIFAAAIFAAAICYKFYILLFLCVLALYRGLFHWRVLTARQYALLAKKYGTENWVRRISFGEENIVTSEENISLNTPCSEVAEIKEKDNYIKLLLKNRTAIRLYSDCFVTGTWAACREHLLRHINSD